jgi:26S proteasome regulatory subunit N2
MLNQNKKLHSDEWGNFVSVLVQLNEVGRVAEILWELIQGDDFILAYQIAIDLADNQRPHFINQLVSSLPVQEHLAEKRSKLITILTGELQRKATLHFLKEHNQADQSILSQIKTATDPKQSVPHGAALMAHAIMQTGTQDSSFLRNNIGNPSMPKLRLGHQVQLLAQVHDNCYTRHDL